MYRTALAALHYNENGHRPQAVNSMGELQYSVVFPKFKHGECSIQKIKEAPTYGNECDILLVLSFVNNVNQLNFALVVLI